MVQSVTVCLLIAFIVIISIAFLPVCGSHPNLGMDHIQQVYRNKAIFNKFIPDQEPTKACLIKCPNILELGRLLEISFP